MNVNLLCNRWENNPGYFLSKEVKFELTKENLAPVGFFFGFKSEFGTIVYNGLYSRLSYSKISVEFNVIVIDARNEEKFYV